jgi:hypothetical protein
MSLDAAINGHRAPLSSDIRDRPIAVRATRLLGWGRLTKRLLTQWRSFILSITTDANEMVAEIHDRMPLNPRARRLRPLAKRRSRPAQPDASVPG